MILVVEQWRFFENYDNLRVINMDNLMLIICVSIKLKRKKNSFSR